MVLKGNKFALKVNNKEPKGTQIQCKGKKESARRE